MCESDHQSLDASSPPTEDFVTPRMLDAGSRVLWETYDCGPISSRLVAKDVYQAMLRASLEYVRKDHV